MLAAPSSLAAPPGRRGRSSVRSAAGNWDAVQRHRRGESVLPGLPFAPPAERSGRLPVVAGPLGGNSVAEILRGSRSSRSRSRRRKVVARGTGDTVRPRPRGGRHGNHVGRHGKRRRHHRPTPERRGPTSGTDRHAGRRAVTGVWPRQKPVGIPARRARFPPRKVHRRALGTLDFPPQEGPFSRSAGGSVGRISRHGTLKAARSSRSECPRSVARKVRDRAMHERLLLNPRTDNSTHSRGLTDP